MTIAITLQDFGKETLTDHFYTKNILYKLDVFLTVHYELTIY